MALFCNFIYDLGDTLEAYAKPFISNSSLIEFPRALCNTTPLYAEDSYTRKELLNLELSIMSLACI